MRAAASAIRAEGEKRKEWKVLIIRNKEKCEGKIKE